MAGKLSIRRVGTILPTLSLVGLLLVISVFIWLCTAGLPGCALRYIEQEAAKAGINLSIEKIRLTPKSGLALKAENIVLTQEQKEAAPAVLQVKKAQIAFSLTRLITGNLKPENIQITRGKLVLPLSHEPGDELTLKNVDVYTAFFRNSNGISANLTADLHHVDLNVKLGALNLPDSSGQGGNTELDIPAALASVRPTLIKVKEHLQNQQWTDKEHPDVNITFLGGERWRVQVKADIPNFEIRNFQIRDAQADAAFDATNLTVSNLKLRTINPDTQVRLQGGYNWKSRELDFHTVSTAPIIRMLNEYLEEDAPRVLQRLSTSEGNTPTIELDGNISFCEDFALNNISVRGKIEQKNAHLGSVPVNTASLSFFMRNGQFSIDTLNLTMPDGHIMAEAYAANEAGYANLDISLPDETILALVHEFAPESQLHLPEGLSFDSNLKLRTRINLALPDFEPGKSHLDDLVPVLRSGDMQFNCDEITYKGNGMRNNAFTLHIDGIDYSGDNILAENIRLDARIGSARMTNNRADSAEALLGLKLENLQWHKQAGTFSLPQMQLSISTDSASWEDTKLSKLQASAQIANIRGDSADMPGTLQSDAFSLKLYAGELAHGENEARGIYIDASVPEGLNLTDAWQSMQRNASIQAEVLELCGSKDFQVQNARLELKNTAENQASLDLSLGKDAATARLSATIALQQDSRVKLDISHFHADTAGLAPILSEYMPAELKLPESITARGNAIIDPETGRLIHCTYDLTLPRLIRVCHNVHVHKGMEIPLSLHIDGSFSTRENGDMHYEADIHTLHQLGELSVHVSGNPLSDCHITGSSSMPVNIVNALIDNADAHWIMRDFRCRDGITRTLVSNIDTTIRYDKGIYVHARCDAELFNLDFLLGAIRDKEDAQGNPTGEEYLRKDMGKDPYSRIKHGTCGVEVLVQMDCVNEQGEALPERIDINLLNPDVLYDNGPWLKRMKIKNGAATSRITGEAVRFDIEKYTISLHKLKGTCYPAYSIGMYYAPIQRFLEDVALDVPADIETEYCIFPLSRKCKVPMKGLIHAKAATGAGFRFLGTTIPLTNFSGFINISDVDVYLDRMNAQSWGGSLDGSLRINFAGKDTTLDGFFVARNLDLKDIVASYGAEFSSACCNGFIRFQAASPDLEAVRAYGQVHLTDGDLLQIGLFRPIGAFLSDVPGNLTKLQETVYIKKEDTPPSWVDKVIRSIFHTGSNAIDVVQDSAYKVPFANHFLRYGIDEAFSRFDIMGGHLITRNMKAKGYNLDVDVQMDIDLNTLTLNGDLWPRISSVPTLIISPISILSDFLIDINVYGDLVSPQWEFGLSKKLKGAASSMTSEPQKKEPLKTE